MGRPVRLAMAITVGLAAASAALADSTPQMTKDNNVFNLNMMGSWVQQAGMPPTPDATTVALWDATVTGPNVTILGGSPTWLGIVEIDPAGSITINADGNAVTLLDRGINLSIADQPFTINCDVVLGANQTWQVLSPAVLTVGGNVAVGTFTLSFTADNTNAINGAISGSGTINKNGVGQLVLGGASAYAGSISVNNGSIEFSASQSVGPINGATGTTVQVDPTTVVSMGKITTLGTLAINGSAQIQANASLSNRTSQAAIVTLPGSSGAWTGLLDLKNNNLIVGSATNNTSFANIRNQITQAAGAPAPANPWNGAGGITSSSAAAASTTATKTALGYASGAEYTALTSFTLFDSLPFNTTDTLIKYTLVGDANLDGTVNINDFFALSGHINQPGDWSQGDFNYTGTVNINDFFAMTGNFNKTLAVGNLLPATGGGSGGAAPQVAAAPTPEPSSLMVLGLASIGLLARRRTLRRSLPG